MRGAAHALAATLLAAAPALGHEEGPAATPPPYRYAAEAAIASAGTPARARVSAPLADASRRALTFATPDGQATLLLNAGTVPPRKGERAVEARILPLDPARLDDAPGGTILDGNAYRMSVRYVPSGDPVVLRGDATVALRMATHADELYRLGPTGWVRVPGAAQGVNLIGRSSVLGTFVAARRGSAASPTPGVARAADGGVPAYSWALAAGLLLLVVLVVRRRARA